MHWNRQTGFRRVLKAALAGLLAFLLFGAALASGAHRSHETGHQSHAAHHLCLICAMAAGQVDVPWTGAAVALMTPFFVVFRLVSSVCYLDDSFHKFPPGRAPPLLRPL